MKRLEALGLTVLLLCTDIAAQDYDQFSHIAEFTGIASEEEIDIDELERLERYLLRPLKINLENPSRIKESGLLTNYQCVSLADYRLRHGDILSLTELAAIDGFGADFVRRLAPFISLEITNITGQDFYNARRVRQEIDIKGGVRHNEQFKSNFALKYRFEAGDYLQGGIAVSKSFESSRADAVTGNLLWHLKRSPVKLAIGDFNARFGQGLALWSGMSLSGLNKPSSYLKRSSHLSLSNSYTGNYSFRGIAAESNLKSLRMTVFAAFSDIKSKGDLLSAGNLTRLWKNGQAGLTHYVVISPTDPNYKINDMKTSCDFAFTLDGVDIFAETSYDWVSQSVASLAGTVFPISDIIRMAVMLRYYPSSYNPTYSASARALTKCSNEYGAALSSEFTYGNWININGHYGFGSNVRRFSGTFCCDAAYFPVSKSIDVSRSMQFRFISELKVMISSASALELRISERVRTWGIPFRTDIRTNMLYYSKYFDASLRINWLKCENIGLLTYVEGILKIESFKLSFRAGLFHIDNWDDRIYAYERDIPGAFNVPAFYGRGYWLALTGGWRFSGWGRLYARTSMTEYPFQKEKKPGKAELKLMLRIDL